MILAVAVIIADQISKYYISSNMNIGDSFQFIPKILNIYYTTNTGASFGILKNHRWIFMSISSVTIIALIGFFIYLIKIKKYAFLQTAVAFLLGGATGNMIDRIVKGEVVDFLEFAFVNFAIFNIADTFITTGSVMLCLYIIIYKDSIFTGGNENVGHGGAEEE